MSDDAGVRIDVYLGPGELRADLERDVRVGLTAEQKWLPPIWFYDERGSQLFDEITRLPEYYPTRVEREILEHHADKIATAAAAETLVELGSGTSEKTRLLLTAMRGEGSLRSFVPFDVSEETLRGAGGAIAQEFPGLHVHAVVGDFHRHLDRLPRLGTRLVAFLGGTIGNLDPDQRQTFLGDVTAMLEPGDLFLLGTDLVKEEARLVGAYDDAAGVTAEFNRNVLRRLNADLEADFNPDAFRHVALWNEKEQWIEMRLRADGPQEARVKAIDLPVHFDDQEDLLTEISAKFTPERVVGELWDAGLSVLHSWSDEGSDFQLTLASRRI